MGLNVALANFLSLPSLELEKPLHVDLPLGSLSGDTLFFTEFPLSGLLFFVLEKVLFGMSPPLAAGPFSPDGCVPCLGLGGGIPR